MTCPDFYAAPNQPPVSAVSLILERWPGAGPDAPACGTGPDAGPGAGEAGGAREGDGVMLTRETITVDQWRTLKGAAEQITNDARTMHDTPFDYAFKEALLSAAYAFQRLKPLLDIDIEALRREIEQKDRR